MAIRANTATGLNIGVDVGKFLLDFFIHEQNIHRLVANTPESICNYLNRIAHYQVERIAMGATGRYELPLAEAAYLRGMPVVIAKPLSIPRHASAVDQLA